MKPPMTIDRADLANRPSPVVGDILERLERAEIIIADLTGHNPNVLYEVGLAHARCDSVILIAYRGQALSFDLSGLRCIFFDFDSSSARRNFKIQLSKTLDETRSVGSPQIFESPLERTRAIVQDLETLLGRGDDELRNETVWFSGGLSAFGIGEDEMFDPTETEYRRALLRERDLLLDLARRGCRICCIITPTANSNREAGRVRTLLAFLEGVDKTAVDGIEWAISEMRQKNMYVIGHIAAIEGFKGDSARGYRVSFRQSSADAVSANISLYEKLFENLRLRTFADYSNHVPDFSKKEAREVLREATIFCLRRTLEISGAQPSQAS